ncbi:MAG: Fe-S cluster assembly protein HesB [Pseudomonadota bacterium]
MQYTLSIEPAAPVVTIHRRLLAAFGTPFPALRLDPLSQLVLGLVNVRTRDEVAQVAFENLLLAFKGWDRLQYAASDDLEPIITKVAFPEKKAVTLPAALRAITARRGRLTLDFLEELPTDAARAWLKDIPSVGPKTSASVLNSSTLERRALVVDTQHQRVAKRLGLTPPQGSDEKIAAELDGQMPAIWTAEDISDHHRLMKQLGQTHCRPKAPSCSSCPLLSLCPTGQSRHIRPTRRIPRDDGTQPAYAALSP